MKFAKVVLVDDLEVLIRKGTMNNKHVLFVDLCIPFVRENMIDENFITAATECANRAERDHMFDEFDSSAASYIVLKTYETLDKGDTTCPPFFVKFNGSRDNE